MNSLVVLQYVQNVEIALDDTRAKDPSTKKETRKKQTEPSPLAAAVVTTSSGSYPHKLHARNCQKEAQKNRNNDTQYNPLEKESQ